MLLAYLRDALGMRELVETLALAPGKGRSMCESVLLVGSRLSESLWMLLEEVYPFYFLLEETEGTAGP